MILRLTAPAARSLVVLFALTCAALFFYSGVRNALAIHYAGINTLQGFQRAARLEPDDARTWYLLGRYWQYNIEDPDIHQAVRAYQEALSRDPHSADTWLDLAMAYEMENDVPAARGAFAEAQRAYPLSPEVAWRFGNFLLRRGDTDAAFAELRRAVLVDPKRGAAAFALCMRVEPDFDLVLERVLPRSPEAYLSVISALVEQQKAEQALTVWSKLVDLRPHLVLSDSSALLELLIRRLQMIDAERVWRDTLTLANISRPAGPVGSLVWDGGFESNIRNAAFTWRYADFVDGVQVGVDSQQRHSGDRSLRLTFNGLRNTDFHEVCQCIAVEPARSYHFSAWVQTRSLSTDQGVRFALQSIGSTTRSIARTDDVRGTQPWTQIERPWTSAPDVRQLQLCIERMPSAKFDSNIRGSAWVDDITLSAVSTENSKQ